MGWQRPEWTVFFKKPAGKTTTNAWSSCVKFVRLQKSPRGGAWLTESGPPDFSYMNATVAFYVGLSETQVRHESTILLQVVIGLKGDQKFGCAACSSCVLDTHVF